MTNNAISRYFQGFRRLAGPLGLALALTLTACTATPTASVSTATSAPAQANTATTAPTATKPSATPAATATATTPPASPTATAQPSDTQAPSATPTASATATATTPAATATSSQTIFTAASIWNTALVGGDTMTGNCSGPYNPPYGLVQITPNPTGLLWHNTVPEDYNFAKVADGQYTYSGPNGIGTGSITLQLTFTSDTTLTLFQTFVSNAEPECTHTHTYAGTFQYFSR